MRLVFATLGEWLPGLMGRWAYRLWFRTHRFRAPAPEQAIAGHARRRTLSVAGVPVVVYEWGSGPAVVFVHGWSGRGTQAAAFVDAFVAAGCRVVGFDAPAHGETPGRQTNILEIAASLQAIADEYGPVQGVITHSFGGMVLAYALNHGLQAGRVVCICPPASVDSLVDNFQASLQMTDATVRVLRQRLEQRFHRNIWEELSTVANARRQVAPALFIHDTDDGDVPWQEGKRVADAWPGAEYLQTSGLGHRRILRDPDVVRAAVDFIVRPPLAGQEAG